MFVILYFLGFFLITECATLKKQNVCSSSPGTSFRPDPRTCRCYYQCNQGFYQKHLCCQDLQYFNPKTQECDNATNVNCLIAKDVEEKIASTEVTSFKPPVKPDFEICFDGIGYYADLEDEACYYQCDANNYAHRRCCAKGLIFNREIRACDW